MNIEPKNCIGNLDAQSLSDSMEKLNLNKDPLEFLYKTTSLREKICDLREALPILSHEELLISLIYLSASDSRRRTAGLITNVLYNVVHDLLVKGKNNCDRSIFTAPSWLQDLVPYVRSPEKLKAQCLHIMQKVLHQKRQVGFIETTPLSTNELDSKRLSSIEPNNSFHQWHALCYWLSNFVDTSAASAEVAIKTFKKCIDTRKEWYLNQRRPYNDNEDSCVSTALSYLFSFSQKEHPVNLDASCIQKLSLDEWMHFPQSQWFITSCNDDTHSKEIVFNKATNFLCNKSYTPEIRFHQALAGFSQVRVQTIELIALRHLLESIVCLAEDMGDNNPSTKERVQKLFVQVTLPTWNYNDFFDMCALTKATSVSTLSQDILNKLLILFHLMGEQQQDHSSYANRLISAYKANIQPCKDRLRAKTTNDTRAFLILNAAYKTNLDYLDNEIDRLSSFLN